MIKFRRGSTKNWHDTKTKLESGQPGYDKNKHKIKIGDGEKTWPELPYASGLFAEEILDSEANAKNRLDKDTYKEDKALITYGTEAPNENTVGQLYLQHYESEPEVDYIVRSGIDGIWTYQVWKSGVVKCWGTVSLTTNVQTAIEGVGLFQDNNKMKSVTYPLEFKAAPTEVATIQSPGGIVWLANKAKNTAKASGVYTILSPDKQVTSANYLISLQVNGMLKK